MTTIIIGLLFLIAGFCILYYCSDLVEGFGPIQMIEQYMSTRNFYLVVGCVLIMIGVWYIFGVFVGETRTSDPKSGFGSSII